MSDTTIEALPAQSRQALRDAAAAASAESVPEPSRAEPSRAEGASPVLTTEDVAGTKPAEGKTDRQLVAPSVREFLRAQTPKTEPAKTVLESEISDLRAALDGLAGKKPAELSVEERTLAKLEALELRDLERTQADDEARAVEEYDNQVRTMREGVIANIDAKKEDYPGLVALEQHETVFNALMQRSQDGLETSEDEISSEVEDGLVLVYQKLHAVYGPTPSSEETQPGSEPKVTLTPGLAGQSEAADTENMSRSERIEYLWAKTQKQT